MSVGGGFSRRGGECDEMTWSWGKNERKKRRMRERRSGESNLERLGLVGLSGESDRERVRGVGSVARLTVRRESRGRQP